MVVVTVARTDRHTRYSTFHGANPPRTANSLTNHPPQTVTQLGWFDRSEDQLRVFGLRDPSEYYAYRRGWFCACIAWYGRYRRAPAWLEMWAPVAMAEDVAARVSVARARERAIREGYPEP